MRRIRSRPLIPAPARLRLPVRPPRLAVRSFQLAATPAIRVSPQLLQAKRKARAWYRQKDKQSLVRCRMSPRAIKGASPGVAATDAAASEDASQAASSLSDRSTGADQLAPEDQAKLNPATLQIYPLRSYMDEGELRRRGGPAYTVPRRHAEELVQRNLASLEPLKE